MQWIGGTLLSWETSALLSVRLELENLGLLYSSRTDRLPDTTMLNP